MSTGKGTLNKVQLIGRLGHDPEIKYTANGTAVANFSIATNRVWKNDAGENIEKTDWHRVIAWRKTAEIIEKYLKKGSQVYIDGHLETRTWDDEKGVKRYLTEVIVEQLVMLGSNSNGGSSNIPLPDEPPESNTGNKQNDSEQSKDEADDLPF